MPEPSHIYVKSPTLETSELFRALAQGTSPLVLQNLHSASIAHGVKFTVPDVVTVPRVAWPCLPLQIIAHCCLPHLLCSTTLVLSRFLTRACLRTFAKAVPCAYNAGSTSVTPKHLSGFSFLRGFFFYDLPRLDYMLPQHSLFHATLMAYLSCNEIMSCAIICLMSVSPLDSKFSGCRDDVYPVPRTISGPQRAQKHEV